MSDAKDALAGLRKVSEDFEWKLKSEEFLHVCGGCGFYAKGTQSKGMKIYHCCPNCSNRIMQQLRPVVNDAVAAIEEAPLLYQKDF